MSPNVCGRFLLLTLGDEIVAHFRLAEAYRPRPRYNIAPRQEVLTVGQSPDGRRGMATTRWGLVPRWAPDTTKAPINARSETVARLEFFKDSFRERRCLVPASGFYEWEVLPGRKKRPWLFRFKGGGPFAFAGIWSAWKPDDGAAPLFTCAILTTAPNDVVKPVHDRMPLVLPPEHYDTWLDRSLTDPAGLKPLLRPYPTDLMEALPLAPVVNNVTNDGPECLTPA
jgi:putative SOS response-associated peptidase YedK